MTSVVPDAGVEHDKRLRDILVVFLAINSGATDAIGYLALGGAFTSVMTGNMVLFGLSIARHDGNAAAHTGLAIVLFILGCAVGARVAGTAAKGQPIWPGPASRAFIIQAGLTIVFAVGWWSSNAHPTGNLQLALLLVNALALGMQSSTVQRFGVSGLSTTYLTGTLTHLVIRLASGQKLRDVNLHWQLLVGLVGGAAVGGLLVLHAHWIAPVLPLFCILTVVLSGLLLMHERRHGTDPVG
jgi:uncharacterized membrane protein YoaK (UPF0700 family)